MQRRRPMKNKTAETDSSLSEVYDYDEETESENTGSDEVSEQEEELSEEEQEALLQKERKKEIRHILLGNFVVFEDGSYGAGSGAWVSPFGFSDGALRTLNFGISRKRFLYTSSVKNNTKILYDVLKAMKQTGRRLILATAPEYPVCYVKSYIFRPVVLMLEPVSSDKNNTEFVLHAYCSRSLLSILSILRAVSRLNKNLPSQITQNGRKNKTK